MYNLNYAPTTLGVQSWREIISGGYANKKGWIPPLLYVILNSVSDVTNAQDVGCHHKLRITTLLLRSRWTWCWPGTALCFTWQMTVAASSLDINFIFTSRDALTTMSDRHTSHIAHTDRAIHSTVVLTFVAPDLLSFRYVIPDKVHTVSEHRATHSILHVHEYVFDRPSDTLLLASRKACTFVPATT
jgi:hypothetical protein